MAADTSAPPGSLSQAAERAEILQGIRALHMEQMVCRRQSDLRFEALELRTRGLEARLAALWGGEAGDHEVSVAWNETSNGAPASTFVSPAASERPRPTSPDLNGTSPGQCGALESTLSGAGSNGSRKKVERMASFASELVPHAEPKEELASWKRIVTSSRFDLVIGTLIVLNTLVMSLQVEYNGRLLGDALRGDCDMGTSADEVCPQYREQEIESAFKICEQAFSACFFMELLVRVAVFGIPYFRNMMNLADAVVVTVSTTEAWILMSIGNDSSDRPNIVLLRLIRLVRLSKVLRVVRVMKAFKALRVLVAAVAASIGAVAWSMILLFVMELIGAIFLAQVLHAYIMDENLPIELRDWIWENFGTWWNAMLSIFEVTMAPGGFIRFRRLYSEVNFLFALFFMSYVCLVTFAVVRVITAMFLKATLQASDAEERIHAMDKAHMFEDSATRLQAKIDKEGQPGMSNEELNELLALPQFREWLSDLGVTRSDARRLYNALDQGKGGVTYTHFIQALLRATGAPRALDVMTIFHECCDILARVKHLERFLSAVNTQDGADFEPIISDPPLRAPGEHNEAERASIRSDHNMEVSAAAA